MVSARCAARGQHRGQHGLTLIEVIVSIVILAIIGGVVATLYSVGLKAVAPSGPQGRLLGANDLTILEQTLGQDGARAACITLPTTGSHYGSCSNGFATLVGGQCPSATTLCIGWPQVSTNSCHVAVYMVNSTGPGTVAATRTEYGGGPPTPVSLARDLLVNFVFGTPVTGTPAGESYVWIKALPIKITASSTPATQTLANPPSETLTLQPVASDPGGINNSLSSGPPPC